MKNIYRMSFGYRFDKKLTSDVRQRNVDILFLHSTSTKKHYWGIFYLEDQYVERLIKLNDVSYRSKVERYGTNNFDNMNFSCQKLSSRDDLNISVEDYEPDYDFYNDYHIRSAVYWDLSLYNRFKDKSYDEARQIEVDKYNNGNWVDTYTFEVAMKRFNNDWDSYKSHEERFKEWKQYLSTIEIIKFSSEFDDYFAHVIIGDTMYVDSTMAGLVIGTKGWKAKLYQRFFDLNLKVLKKGSTFKIHGDRSQDMNIENLCNRKAETYYINSGKFIAL